MSQTPAEQRVVVIIGAGHAGGALAANLRTFGFTGRIVLIGDEDEVPYQRPPLSKGYFCGTVATDAVHLRPRSYYDEEKIDLHLTSRVESLDLAAKRVLLSNGLAVHYDVLVVATGSRARNLPVAGADLGNIYVLRTLNDAKALQAAVKAGSRVVIVGGGYVGLELAASARKMEASATVIENGPRCLSRVTCEPISSLIEAYHRDYGVTILTNESVTRFEGAGTVMHAVLASGEKIPCDVAVIGVGALPNDDLARAAGISCSNGITVDHQGRTSAPDVFAIGDVTYRPIVYLDGQKMRLESVQNALEQAKQVASAIVGRAAPAAEIPWFWSDQYDLKVQIAGVPLGSDELVLRAGPEKNKLAAFYLKDTRVIAVEAVNASPEFIVGKQLISSGKQVDKGKLGDPAFPIRQIAATR